MTGGAAGDDLDIRPEVARRLGHYVYLYIDPRTEQPFYVGKGQGERALSHLSEEAESRKCARIAELTAEGKTPRIDILAHGLRDEETAFRIEAAIIDLFGLDVLTNEVRGWRSLQLGRIPLSELTMYYAATPVEVDVPAADPDQSPLPAQHDAAGVVRDYARRLEARAALHEGAICVRGVRRSRARGVRDRLVARGGGDGVRDASRLKSAGRREFLGRVADAAIRERFVGRSVAKVLKRGLQSPVVYANC